MKKSGISLIAVLMFMLAATTASVVVFKLIGSENFSSGSRLKQSEAYQASESGLAAAQAWLVNRAPDVGELVKTYMDNNGKSIEITKLLGEMSGTKQQKYRVHLVGVNTKSTPMKLKFMSVGIGRDGSEVKQTAFYGVDGLYQVNVLGGTINSDCDVDFNQAFFGGFKNNTQGKFSSAIINGDMEINGFTSNENLIVTGNLSTLDNGDKKIGCPNNPADTPGDVYIAGDFNVRGFTICGNAFVGGNLSTMSNPLFKKDLFVAGNMDKKSTPKVEGNMTLGGVMSSSENDGMEVVGDFVMANVKSEIVHGRPGAHGSINIGGNPSIFANGGGFTVKGNVWTDANISNSGEKTNAGHLKFGTDPGKKAYVLNSVKVGGVDQWKNNNGTPNGILFTAKDVIAPTASNKPAGAKSLEALANKVTECTRPDGRKELCVPDPLALPEETKSEWMAKADTLDNRANRDSMSLKSIAPNCLRLLKGSKPGITGAQGGVNESYDNKGGWYGCGYASQTNFTQNVNLCYTQLKANKPDLLYGDFLAVNMKGCSGTERGQFDGKIIFVFQENVSSDIKLGETTEKAAVFIYFKEGMTGKMAFTGSRNDGKFRNYFIFSEKDIGGASGSTTINGTIFLANGSQSGSITDTDVNFNKALFDELVKAGILTKSGGELDEFGNPKGCKNYQGANDDRWIPISNRLIVTLESKQISTEAEPNEKNPIALEKFILVMPRMVRITKDEFVKRSNRLKDYYNFMFINGATENDRAKTDPSCKPTLKPDGANAEGLYECEFGSPSVKHSNFYVKVAGNQSDPRIWIEPGEASAKVGECVTVSLRAEISSSTERKVNVNKNGGEGWKIDIIENNCSGSNNKYVCKIPAARMQSNIFSVCPGNTSQKDGSVQFTIDQAQGEIYRIDPNANVSNIRIYRDERTVVRIPQDNDGSWKECPDDKKASDWITFTCSSGAVLVEKNRKWMCSVGDNVSWSTIENEACTNAGLYKSGSLTVDPNIENKFQASLKWRTYNLEITGGSGVKLASTEVEAPSITTGSCTNCLYHGAKYTVKNNSATEAYAYCVNQTATCTGANNTGVFGPGDSFTITPTGNTKITLVGANKANITCTLNRTTIKPNDKLAKQDVSLVFSGYGCKEVEEDKYYFDPEWFSSIGEKDVKIRFLSEVCGKTEVPCGKINVVDCEFDCSFCGYKSPSFNDVTLGSRTTQPATGKCVFIKDFGEIQPNLFSTVSINGVKNACGNNWADNCPYNPRPATKDGGYYVYVELGTINSYKPTGSTEMAGWQGIVPAAAKSDACQSKTCTPQSNNSVICDFYTQKYTYNIIDKCGDWDTDKDCIRVPRPVVTCANGVTATETQFNTWWTNNATYQEFKTTQASTRVSLTKANCGSGAFNIADGTVNCGNLTIVPKANTCSPGTSLPTFGNTANNCYTMICSSGQMLQMQYTGGSDKTVNVSGGCTENNKNIKSSPGETEWTDVCVSNGNPFQIIIAAEFSGVNMNARCVNQNNNTTYTLQYNGNNHTGGSPPSDQTQTNNPTFAVKGNENNLTRNGYTFNGWETSGGTSFAPGASIKITDYTNSTSLTLNAKWTSSGGGTSSLVFNGTNESSINNDVTYTITCSSNNPVVCMHTDNAKWYYSINGASQTVCGEGCNSNAINVMSSCTNNATIKITGGVSLKCKNKANGWY